MATIIFYLDITKAFDQVPHRNLLFKLCSSGISGSFYNWLKSYLTGRTQRTHVSGVLSSPASVTSGVVQGSVMGPILFLLYINDIMGCIRNGTPFLFADDVKVIYTCHPSLVENLRCDIQCDLDSLTQWSSRSGLSFSTTKCHALAFRCAVEMQFTLENNPIPTQLKTIDLGLHYTSHFSFAPQVMHQIAKARQITFLILRSFHTQACKIAIFKQHARPILEYCSFVSSHYTKAHRLAIESVQRRFTKALFLFDEQLSYRSR